MSATMDGHVDGSKRRLDVTNVPADELCSYADATLVDGGRLHLERKGGRTYLVTR